MDYEATTEMDVVHKNVHGRYISLSISSTKLFYLQFVVINWRQIKYDVKSLIVSIEKLLSVGINLDIESQLFVFLM